MHLIYCPFNEPHYLDIASKIISELLAEDQIVRIVKARKSAPVTEYYSTNVLCTDG
jgi:hypothetical protein